MYPVVPAPLHTDLRGIVHKCVVVEFTVLREPEILVVTAKADPRPAIAIGNDIVVHPDSGDLEQLIVVRAVLCRDLQSYIAAEDEIVEDLNIPSAVDIDPACAGIILPVLIIVRISFRADVVVMASDWQLLIDCVLAASGSVPVIAEFHNAYDYVMRNVEVSGNMLKHSLTKLYYWQTLKHLNGCSRLVVLTNADADNWRCSFDNVVVIPNPLTCYPDVIDDVPKDCGRIIFVGRFNHEKRIDRLIDAFSLIAERYPGWHVDIFGEGNERQKILDQIKNLKLDGRVIIHEPTKSIYDEYKRSEMLVLCSEHEAYSLVLVEAMSCGVPCVSLDCPVGPREIIQDGVTGLLAQDGNVQDLSMKMPPQRCWRF